ncbi:MAG: phosphotransferase [Candidatus Margulisiibacteriota bacterium]|jgi:Ser/Thr protein kinase RdoA (MazF antagonist)
MIIQRKILAVKEHKPRLASQPQDASLLQLINKELLAINYDLPEIVLISELGGGFSIPKPLLIKTKSGDIILKEIRVGTEQDMNDLLNCITALEYYDLPIAKIIQARDGKRFFTIAQKKYWLEEMATGNHISRLEANKMQVREVGSYLAKAHTIMENIEFKRTGRSARNLMRLVETYAGRFNSDNNTQGPEARQILANEKTFVLSQLQLFRKNFGDDQYNALHSSPVFYDLNFDNMLFDQEGKIASVFDLERLCSLPRIMEFRAPIMNAGPGKPFIYDFDLLKELVHSYAKEVSPPLSKKELCLIPEVFRQAFLYLFYHYTKNEFGDLNAKGPQENFQRFIEYFHQFVNDLDKGRFADEIVRPLQPVGEGLLAKISRWLFP